MVQAERRGGVILMILSVGRTGLAPTDYPALRGAQVLFQTVAARERAGVNCRPCAVIIGPRHMNAVPGVRVPGEILPNTALVQAGINIIERKAVAGEFQVEIRGPAREEIVDLATIESHKFSLFAKVFSAANSGRIETLWALGESELAATLNYAIKPD
jgi:hypothetical protein